VVETFKGYGFRYYHIAGVIVGLHQDGSVH
jgi:hypothetical protein